MWKWIKRYLGESKSEISAAEEALRHMDDLQILGAFETVKIGEWFERGAQKFPDRAGDFPSLSEAFRRAGTARLRALKRAGYEATIEDEYAQKKVDAWRSGFAQNPDQEMADDINAFLKEGASEFAAAYPAVWRRLQRKL